MNLPALIQPRSWQAERGDWLAAIDHAIQAAEAAELELSRQGGSDPSTQRKASGSYYTPSDVAGHFWDLFFRHHRIRDLPSLLSFLGANDLVEPAAGSGMFVFSFLRKAALLGATPESLAVAHFHVVDVNPAALRFFSERLHEIEEATGTRLAGIRPFQGDFLNWLASSGVRSAVFVGNPPFVANPRGHRWRNLYADFVEAMLNHGSTRAISLILPLSICFSRDYADLRGMIRSASMGVSASSYDNIPDRLFKAGKPDSTNTNRANSQRCTILNLGGPDPYLREASALLSWSASERASVLSSIPTFRRFSDDDGSGQIPRPASEALTRYMEGARGARPLRAFLSKSGRPAFAVGGVARNFIGIRDFESVAPGIIPIRVASEEDGHVALQVLASRLFHDYWRTYGDGFHVTVELIERFPVTEELARRYGSDQARAGKIWADRAAHAKVKMNSGQMVRSYDLRAAFEGA